MKTLLVIGMILALFVSCAHSPDYVPTHEGTMATADLEADTKKIGEAVEIVMALALLGLIVFCVAGGALILW